MKILGIKNEDRKISSEKILGFVVHTYSIEYMRLVI